MTQRATAARYAELAAGQEAVESCLLDSVAEHLNGEGLILTCYAQLHAVSTLCAPCTRHHKRALLHPPLFLPPAAEVVLGTVRDVTLAITWLKTTFLYVRIRANPARYK